jgi:hypothetical protein
MANSERRRLGSFENVIRLDETKVAETIFENKPEGRRTVERKAEIKMAGRCRE